MTSTPTLFGALLCDYRERLGGIRRSQKWLAARLLEEGKDEDKGKGKSYISRLESGNQELRGFPHRDRLLQIGRLLSLTSDEMNTFLAAAKVDFRASKNNLAEYGPLTEEDRYRPFYGPEADRIRGLQTDLRLAEEAYLRGELWVAGKIAERIMIDIDLATCDEKWAEGIWSPADREEHDRLFLQAWYQFYLAVALLEPGNILRGRIAPYTEQAYKRKEKSRDPVLKALVSYFKGDWLHVFENHQAALDQLLQTSSLLPDPDYRLAVFTQLGIIKDLPFTTQFDKLDGQIRVGYERMKLIPPNDVHTRVMMLDAIGRSWGYRGDNRCWHPLNEALEEAVKGGDLLGQVASRYSYMVALTHKHGKFIDRDELRDVGKRALDLAATFRWERRKNQILTIAREAGVDLLE